jgi:hypothetical protein
VTDRSCAPLAIQQFRGVALNHLSNYAKVLALEAELQRVALGVQLSAARHRSDWSRLLPVVGLAAGWLVKSGGGWRIGAIWLATRLAFYWRHRRKKLS